MKNFSPEFAVRTELKLEELVTKLALVANIVTKVEISVGHYPFTDALKH